MSDICQYLWEKDIQNQIDHRLCVADSLRRSRIEAELFYESKLLQRTQLENQLQVQRQCALKAQLQRQKELERLAFQNEIERQRQWKRLKQIEQERERQRIWKLQLARRDEQERRLKIEQERKEREKRERQWKMNQEKKQMERRWKLDQEQKEKEQRQRQRRLQKARELELQREKQKQWRIQQQQRERQLEIQRQKRLKRQKQLQRQKQKQRQKQIEQEQKELQLERQKQWRIQKYNQLEKQRQKQRQRQWKIQQQQKQIQFQKQRQYRLQQQQEQLQLQKQLFLIQRQKRIAFEQQMERKRIQQETLLRIQRNRQTEQTFRRSKELQRQLEYAQLRRIRYIQTYNIVQRNYRKGHWQEILKQSCDYLHKEEFFQLIQFQVKQIQIQLNGTTSICRLCQQQIPFDSLGQHTKVCLVKYSLIKKMKQISRNISNLIQLINEYVIAYAVRCKGKTTNYRNILIENQSQQQKQIIIETPIDKCLDMSKHLKKIENLYDRIKRNSSFEQDKDIATKINEQLNKMNNICIDQQIIKIVNDLSLQFQSRSKLYAKIRMCQTKKKFFIKCQMNIESNQSLSPLSFYSDNFSNNSCSLQSTNNVEIENNTKILRPSIFKTRNKHGQQKESKQPKKKAKIQSKETYLQVIQNSSPQYSQQFQPKSQSKTIIKSKKKLTKSRTERIKKDSKKKPEQEFKYSLFELTEIRCKSEGQQPKNIMVEEKVSISQFSLIKKLGKGAYGSVYLCSKKKTNDLYALKIIQESKDLKKTQTLRTQQKIFSVINGDYVVKASYTLSADKYHIFVLQYMKGGDFGKLLMEEVYLQNQIAKFYVAEIVLAIQYLHSINIIHRDLKPVRYYNQQNLVIDDNGHLKLTDFGLSEIGIKRRLIKKCTITDLQNNNKQNKKQILLKDSKKTRIIGTPDYIAPQLIKGISSNRKESDWWSLGIITYQILVGVCPFSDKTIEQVFSNILQLKIQWPTIGYQQQMMTPQAQDFICKLLNLNHQQRLGSRGSSQVKIHPFLKGIDWNNIKKQLPPLFHRNDEQNDNNEENNEQIPEQIKELFIKGRAKNNNGLYEDLFREDILYQVTLKSQQKQKQQLQKQVKMFNKRKKKEQLQEFSRILKK